MEIAYVLCWVDIPTVARFINHYTRWSWESSLGPVEILAFSRCDYMYTNYLWYIYDMSMLLTSILFIY